MDYRHRLQQTLMWNAKKEDDYMGPQFEKINTLSDELNKPAALTEKISLRLIDIVKDHGCSTFSPLSCFGLPWLHGFRGREWTELSLRFWTLFSAAASSSTGFF